MKPRGRRKFDDVGTWEELLIFSLKLSGNRGIPYQEVWEFVNEHLAEMVAEDLRNIKTEDEIKQIINDATNDEIQRLIDEGILFNDNGMFFLGKRSKHRN